MKSVQCIFPSIDATQPIDPIQHASSIKDTHDANIIGSSLKGEKRNCQLLSIPNQLMTDTGIRKQIYTSGPTMFGK